MNSVLQDSFLKMLKPRRKRLSIHDLRDDYAIGLGRSACQTGLFVVFKTISFQDPAAAGKSGGSWIRSKGDAR